MELTESIKAALEIYRISIIIILTVSAALLIVIFFGKYLSRALDEIEDIISRL